MSDITTVCIVGIDGHTDQLVNYLQSNTYDLQLVVDDQESMKEIVLRKYKCFFETYWDEIRNNNYNIIYISYMVPNNIFLSILKSSCPIVMDISTALYYYEQDKIYPQFLLSDCNIYSIVRLNPNIRELKNKIEHPQFIQITCIENYPVYSIEYELDLLYFITDDKPKYINANIGENIWTTTLEYESGLIACISKISSQILRPCNKINIMMENNTYQEIYSLQKNSIPAMHTFDLHEYYYVPNIQWIYNCKTAIKRSRDEHRCVDVEKELFRD
jgi:hypothetical protein